MATPRFFCCAPLAARTTIELPADLAHHAIRVLRLKPDTAITLFDGRGGEYPARLLVDGKKAYAEIGDHAAIEAELPGNITLVQGMAGGDKMDWIIEKAAELGAIRLVPVAARKSVLQLSGDRLAKRLVHWRRIAQAASEQCGRNRIMLVAEPMPLQACVAQISGAGQAALFCDPAGRQTLAQALAQSPGDLTLLVGPEGGWSTEEQALVKENGLTPVRFGRRVLRTETAGLALIAAVTALRGWE
ncbi:MAG TPA: 16S rRNA (uracil(1498)-N(3))-methyltransferase [Candidimonas sp.]|nr:16S rRNA (uracil(1498)-N(3))-methyltransferase [Candidimonas sp.]